MAKEKIRTKYIKGLIADKENLSRVLEESTKASLSYLLDDSVNRTIRQVLSESEDDYTEEEVNPKGDLSFEEGSEGDGGFGSADNSDAESGSADNGSADDAGQMAGEGDGDEGVWNNLEQFKDSDGEYDLRGQDIDKVLDILQQIDPNDEENGIRIVKTSDSTAEVIPDGEGEEFEINIEGGDNAETPNEFEKEGPTAMDDNLDGNDGLDNENGGEGEGGDTMDDINLNDLEGGENSDEGEGNTFELELGDDNDNNNNDDMVNEGNVDLGYTDNYQKKTAMTMPHDKGEGEGDSRFDQGAPTGDGKRWVGTDGANGGNPYTKKVNENDGCEGPDCGNEDGTIFEVVMDDPMGDEGSAEECGDASMMEGASTITRNNAYTNSVGRNQVHSPEQDDKVRNSHREAGQKRGTGVGRGLTNESKEMEDFRRKANAILAENKELKEIATQIKNKLHEAAVINSSLAKVVKLFTENTTSRNEKINILNRFDKVQTLKESRELYEQISGELNQNVRRDNKNLIASQIVEAKSNNNNMIVETNMLNTSAELQQILDLQERLMKV